MTTATMSTMTTMSTMPTSTGRVVLLASVSIDQYTVDGIKFTFTVLSLIDRALFMLYSNSRCVLCV